MTANAPAKPATNANSSAQNSGVEDPRFAAMLATAEPQAKPDSPPKTNHAKRTDAKSADAKSADAKDTKPLRTKAHAPKPNDAKLADAKSAPLLADNAKAGAADTTNPDLRIAGTENKGGAGTTAGADKKDGKEKGVAANIDAVVPGATDPGNQQPIPQQQTSDATTQAASLIAAPPQPGQTVPATDLTSGNKIATDADIKAAANAPAPLPSAAPNANTADAKIQPEAQGDAGGVAGVAGNPPAPAVPQPPKLALKNDKPASVKADDAQIKDALTSQGNVANNDHPAKTDATPAKDAPKTKDAPAIQDKVANNDKPVPVTNNAPQAKDAPAIQDKAASNDKPLSATNSAPQAKDPPATLNSDSNTQAQNLTPPPVQHAAPPTAPEPATPASAGITMPQFAGNNGAIPVAASIQIAPQAHDIVPNVNSLAVEIAAKSQSGAKQFDIRLDPPELGRVDVRLSIDATGKAEAHLTADQPHTLHLLQKDSEVLTRALRDAGLDISQDGLNFSLKGQDRHSGDGHHSPRGAAPSLTLAATKNIDATPTGPIIFSSAGDARLDIHV